MFYEQDFIEEIAGEVEVPHGDYAKITAEHIAALLDGNKLYYKQFGVYWWAMKDALRQYVNNGNWYCGKADDPLMKARASHGDQFLSIVAAAYYAYQQLDYSSEHLWFDKDGEEHPYVLFDENAGC
jgi:hypothetical protein